MTSWGVVCFVGSSLCYFCCCEKGNRTFTPSWSWLLIRLLRYVYWLTLRVSYHHNHNWWRLQKANPRIDHFLSAFPLIPTLCMYKIIDNGNELKSKLGRREKGAKERGGDFDLLSTRVMTFDLHPMTGLKHQMGKKNKRMRQQPLGDQVSVCPIVDGVMYHFIYLWMD